MRSRISLVSLLFAAVCATQTFALAEQFPVDSLAVEGNRNLTTAAILSASGLKRGQPADVATFDAARDRLLASGYFDTVAYRYKPSATRGSTNQGYALTFEVRELAVLYPVRVEALPISTEDAVAYLKSKDPLFTGKMPGTKQVLDRTAQEIAQYLASKNQPADVAGKVVAIAPERFEVDFTPARGLPVIANVTFEGSKTIPAIDLHNKMNEVAIGQPFSDAAFQVLLDNQIRSLYEAKGYMHVVFSGVTTKPAKDVKGLDVNVHVDEGAVYKLTRVSMTGVKDSERAHVLRTAKLPQTTAANFDQIREGAARVQEAMKHEGYLDAEVSTEKKADDEKKTVEFFIAVETGPIYTFGKLTVNGLGLDGEAAVRKLWAIKPGDPFPYDYSKTFVKGVKDDGYFDNLSDIAAAPAIDHSAHTVDVTLDFKGAPAKAKAPRKPGQIYPGAPPL